MKNEIVGRFTYQLASDTWTWSDTMFRLYGLRPGQVAPTTSLITRHLSPEDREHILGLFTASLHEDGQPLARLHRIAASDRDRTVVTLVERASAPGASPELRGYTADITVPLHEAASERARQDIEAAVESHSIIDQAVGALMLVHGLDDDTAISLLRWFSQHSNTKLRTLAERIVHSTRHGIPLPRETTHALDAAISDAAIDESPLSEVLPTPPGVRGHALHVEVQQFASEVVLCVRGSVDLTATPEFVGALSELALTGGSGRPGLVVDLRDVTHVSSAALAELRRFKERAEQQDRKVRILPAAELSAETFVGLLD